MRRSMLRPAFTLIELLVVIAIIAILAAILFPVFATARDKARAAQCISNMRNLASAMVQYRVDYDGAGPFAGWPYRIGGSLNCHAQDCVYTEDWQYTIQPYIRNIMVLRCPSDKSAYETRPVSYLYNNQMAAGRRPIIEAALPTSSDVCLIFEGYGPDWSATMNPIPLDRRQFPRNMAREYTIWGTRAQWLARPDRGMMRHQEGGNVIFFDGHVKFRRYGIGNNNTERLVSIQNAFPFPTTIRPWRTGGNWRW